jgi:hypothetical protein
MQRCRGAAGEESPFHATTAVGPCQWKWRHRAPRWSHRRTRRSRSAFAIDEKVGVREAAASALTRITGPRRRRAFSRAGTLSPSFATP